MLQETAQLLSLDYYFLELSSTAYFATTPQVLILVTENIMTSFLHEEEIADPLNLCPSVMFVGYCLNIYIENRIKVTLIFWKSNITHI